MPPTSPPPTGWEPVVNPKEIQQCVDFYIAHWPAQHQRLTFYKCLLKIYVEPERHQCLYMYRSDDWDANVARRIAASFYLRRVPRRHLEPDEHGWCLCLATQLEMISEIELDFVYQRVESLCTWFRTIGALQEVVQDASRVLPDNLQRLFNKAEGEGRLYPGADDTLGYGWPNPLKRWAIVFP